MIVSRMGQDSNTVLLNWMGKPPIIGDIFTIIPVEPQKLVGEPGR
jgi:hypothetical protein